MVSKGLRLRAPNLHGQDVDQGQAVRVPRKRLHCEYCRLQQLGMSSQISLHVLSAIVQHAPPSLLSYHYFSIYFISMQ